MGYRKFSDDDYLNLKRQHNIMTLVGNGFDIQITQRYGSRFSPRYPAFYYYLMSRGFDSENLIVQQMATARAAGQENWSDIEAAIEDLAFRNYGQHQPAVIHQGVIDIQTAFSEYLELVAPPDLLARIGMDSAGGAWAMSSMANFTWDVAQMSENFGSFTFPRKTDHYHLFNYQFINFNYTPLLDGYIFRDPKQFEPRLHKSSDGNFWFNPNPSSHRLGYGNHQTSWSSFVRSEIAHPHGQQSIPRSLLFGIDAPENFAPGIDPYRHLMKPYWGMNKVEYGHLFPDTELFIVFGCSLGRSDGWWWRRIYEAICRSDTAGDPVSELIIYWWSPSNHSVTRDLILEKFFTAASVSLDDPNREIASNRIQVVIYSDVTHRVFLATP